MSVFDKIRNALSRMMTGRHGPDEFGLFLVIAGLVMDILSIMTGLGIFSLLGMAAYVYAVYRLLSRNHVKRAEENAAFLKEKNMIQTKIRQFINRRKNSKEYKYFRCPGCHALMRLKRGTGEREMVCPKCTRHFQQKA